MNFTGTCSPSSKDKFLQTYEMPEPTHFSLQFAVLELVRLVQSALSIFGMFDITREERNGLLDDYTLAGVQRWVSEIGPYLELEACSFSARRTVRAC